MHAIRIQVVRSRAYCSEDGWHVYGDGGAGSMDWDHPVTSRRQLFWDDVPPVARHLLGGHLMAQHLDGVDPDGLFEGIHLLDEHLYPAMGVAWETEPFVFGRFQHAVVSEDAAGNAETSGVHVYEQVINSDPPPARGLCPQSYDSQTDRLTLIFVPSDRLIG